MIMLFPTAQKTPHFAPALEREFQADYYAAGRPILRAVALFMASVFCLSLWLCHYEPSPLDVPFNAPQIGFWLIIFGLTWTQFFERHWQLIAAFLGALMAIFVLGELAMLLAAAIGQSLSERGDAVPTAAQQKFYFVMRFAVLMISLSVLRLQFRPAALMFGAIVLGGAGAFIAYFPHPPLWILDARYCLLPATVLTVAILLLSFVGEGLSRRAFWATHQLEAERNDERRARQQTQSNLQVLGQAIGGIVHDLGNPLTTVQMGASTLDLVLDNGADPETIRELTAMIGDGSQMLNFLRLSLIEQTRVLEGAPIPVELKPTSALSVAQRGARFQKPSVAKGREVGIECPDALICADEMKMVTVWMNLIGNALKYSDGPVRLEWRLCADPNGDPDGEPLLAMAVLDAGTRGVGLSHSQAARLFHAFGRLEQHAAIEGTGLGLLSVQKIVEAHGGQIYIEGFNDGTPGSGPFSTAHGTHPAMLHGEFRTAFVATCPLATT